jgi:ribosome-associated protein
MTAHILLFTLRVPYFFTIFVRLLYVFMEKLIETIVTGIQDKKGKDIVSLDLTGFDGAICSHFVVCNADSTAQVAAIADGIEEKVYEVLHESPWRVEGKQTGLWVALDYVDVIVHIFQSDLRDYYRLEELWADAPMIRYESED